MIHLHTPRLHLREFVNEDFDDVYTYESDPEMVKYVAYGPYSLEECQRDLQWHVEHQQATPRHVFHLALELAVKGCVIGWCGVQFARRDHYEAEIGYALHRDFWGQGLMTEAARAVVQHSFSALGVQRVFAECRPENVGSIRVLEKLGMAREGHLRQNLSFKGRTWDTLIFGLLKNEWRAQP
jgi:RimJ/RimL family protein N-acetyltransferase